MINDQATFVQEIIGQGFLKWFEKQGLRIMCFRYPVGPTLDQLHNAQKYL